MTYSVPEIPGAPSADDPVPSVADEWPLWEVFVRQHRGLNHSHMGSLHAPDAETAIQNARDVYTRREEGVSIWVVPSALLTASDPADAEAMFGEIGKPYRQATYYEIPDEVGRM